MSGSGNTQRPGTAREQAEPSRLCDTLPGLLDLVWEHLCRGVASARHGFHLPVLASAAPGGEPSARVVVLRGVERQGAGPDADAARRSNRGGSPAAGASGPAVWCHTDARAEKIHHALERPAGAWCFYDREAKLQVRAVGVHHVHRRDALADAAWAGSRPSSRRCYLAPLPPGTPTPAPDPNLPADARHDIPAVDRLEDGRRHFAVLRLAVHTLEVLHLHHAGHRRARFDLRADQASWLAV